MKKFWNWMKNEDTGATELYFEGPISAETWLGDEITPGLFKSELERVRFTRCFATIRAKSQ